MKKLSFSTWNSASCVKVGNIQQNPSSPSTNLQVTPAVTTYILDMNLWAYLRL